MKWVKEKVRKKTKQACREEDSCKYGHNCRFLHMKELNETTKYAIIEIPQTEKEDMLRKDGKKVMSKNVILEEINNVQKDESEIRSKVCTFYLNRKCSKGNGCSYRHPKECRDFLSGQCKYGKECKFAHIRVNSGTAQNLGQMEGLLRYLATQILPQRPTFVPHHLSQLAPQG